MSLESETKNVDKGPGEVENAARSYQQTRIPTWRLAVLTIRWVDGWLVH